MEPCQAHAPCLATEERSVPVLGPFPASAVAALADLGLSDAEIARYFGVHPLRITQLRLLPVVERQIAWRGGR